MPEKNSNPSRPEAELRAVASHFALAGTFASGIAYGSGHIHDTFLLRTRERSGPDYILQCVNHAIFKDVPAMMENIVRVTEHMRRKVSAVPGSDPGREVLTVVPACSGASFHCDEKGDYWRCFLFIDHRELGERPGTPGQAFEAGRLFGRFLNLLADLPEPPLHETIPHFHDLERRLADFHAALDADPRQRQDAAAAEIAFVGERENDMKRILSQALAGGLPWRVTHNDTKFNNVLFDPRGRGVCVIDLDTVMPGHVLYDFGDAIRSAANTAREDEADPERVGLRLDIFRDFAAGYLGELRGVLAAAETRLLAFSARLMTYIIGLRFLSDYIEGDRYFKVGYAEHNLQRARVQFRLLEDMERRSGQMEDIVGRLSEKTTS
jgi:hypothetical protein